MDWRTQVALRCLNNRCAIQRLFFQAFWHIEKFQGVEMITLLASDKSVDLFVENKSQSRLWV